MTELSDGSYDAVRSDIERTRQRVVIGPWAEPHLPRLAYFAIAAAAVLIVGAVGLSHDRQSQFAGRPVGSSLQVRQVWSNNDEVAFTIRREHDRRCRSLLAGRDLRSARPSGLQLERDDDRGPACRHADPRRPGRRRTGHRRSQHDIHRHPRQLHRVDDRVARDADRGRPGDQPVDRRQGRLLRDPGPHTTAAVRTP